MGQNLAIGLATQVGVKKTQVDKAGLSLEQLQENMHRDLHYVPEIYTVSEHESLYLFKIRDDIFYAQLIPFLQSIYPLLYGNEQEREYGCDNVIKALQSMPSSEWINWAREAPEAAFQLNELNEYEPPDYIEFGHGHIPVRYEAILLSAQGKVSMEMYGRQFIFFKYTMMQTFKQFSLSGALRVYITG